MPSPRRSPPSPRISPPSQRRLPPSPRRSTPSQRRSRWEFFLLYSALFCFFLASCFHSFLSSQHPFAFFLLLQNTLSLNFPFFTHSLSPCFSLHSFQCFPFSISFHHPVFFELPFPMPCLFLLYPFF